MNDGEHESEAQLEKEYGDLTPKQKRVVEEIISRRDGEYVKANVARDAGCRGSYVTYVEDNFPHIIEQRRSTMRTPVADGEGSYTFELGASDTFKVIRTLPDELSRKVYDQIRAGSDPGEDHREFRDYDGSERS